jgi:hypothetical protein
MESFPRDDSLARGWQDLGAGAPALIGLAKRTSIALANDVRKDWRTLSREAQALLWAGRERGAYEVVGVNTAFAAADRWLAVHVEQPDDLWWEFRVPQQPEATMRFFAGFAELCSAGLVVHHLYRDFSLTAAGFEAAREVDSESLRELLDLVRR